MNKNIAVIQGDGIGPEITAQAVKVLDVVAEKFDHKFRYNYVLMGGCAIDQCGDPLPSETLETCKSSDATLLGAVGGPKWDDPNSKVRPEQGLLGIRKGLGLFANIRPITVYPTLADCSPLKNEIVSNGVDIVIVRELTGGIYFGDSGRGQNYAYDTEKYTTEEVTRIARTAFKIASGRKKELHSIDKANVLESSRFWRATVNGVAAEFPEVRVSHMYVDNAAMQLVRNPGQFDVVVTSNIFGDILSDEASTITGSIGMLPSASLGAASNGLYEPIHGSAPDIQGLGIANPIAAILSAAMMLELSFDMPAEAAAVRAAVNSVLSEGHRTKDVCGGGHYVGTEKMGELICEKLR